jgi:hypothetical protein
MTNQDVGSYAPIKHDGTPDFSKSVPERRIPDLVNLINSRPEAYKKEYALVDLNRKTIVKSISMEPKKAPKKGLFGLF